MALEDRAIAEAEVLDAIRALTLEVQQSLIDVQLAQENLALARENAASLDEIVTLNQARVRGEVAEVELLRSRIAALHSQQADWPSATTNRPSCLSSRTRASFAS